MFVTDFQVSQGVLIVDTTPITANHIAESPPVGYGGLQKTNQSMPTLSIEVWPGDIPVLKLQINIIPEVWPGDIPVLKP